MLNFLKNATINGSPLVLKPLVRGFDRSKMQVVTVDWVVLTAAIVGLGIAVLTSISGGADETATEQSE